MEHLKPTATTDVPWAVSVPRAAALSTGALRLRAGVQVCDAGDLLWLRGSTMTDELDLDLRKLPGARRFTIAPDGRLTPAGARVPTVRLPDTGWSPLREWLTPEPQPAAPAGRVGRKASLRLVRAGHEEPANVLLTSTDAWADWASSAPAVRLRRLRFAASADGRVLVRGTPLPPIPSDRFVEHEGIAIPCGFALSLNVDPPVLRTLLGLDEQDLVVFDEQGGHERIAAGCFAQATRSAARATRSLTSDL